MQRYLRFVHKERVRLLVLHEHGEQYDEHLLLTTAQLVWIEVFVVLKQHYLVASTIHTFPGVGKQLVYEVKEMVLLRRYLLCLLLCIGCILGEELHHTVGHIHLIVQIAALQLIELEVQFAMQTYISHLGQYIARDERTVKRANHIKPHLLRSLWSIGQCHSVVCLCQPVHIEQVFHNPIQYGALSHSIHTTQDVDIGAQVPHNMMQSRPKRFYFYATDVCHRR